MRDTNNTYEVVTTQLRFWVYSGDQFLISQWFKNYCVINKLITVRY